MSKHLFIKLSFLIFLTLLIHQTSQAHVGSTCSTHAECNANPSNICVQEICQKALTLPGEPSAPWLWACFKPDPNQ